MWAGPQARVGYWRRKEEGTAGGGNSWDNRNENVFGGSEKGFPAGIGEK